MFQDPFYDKGARIRSPTRSTRPASPTGETDLGRRDPGRHPASHRCGTRRQGQGRRLRLGARHDRLRAPEDRDQRPQHGEPRRHHKPRRSSSSSSMPQRPREHQRRVREAPGRFDLIRVLVRRHRGRLGLREQLHGEDRGARVLVPGGSKRPGRQRPDLVGSQRRAPACSPTCSSTTCSTTRSRWTTSPGTATSPRRKADGRAHLDGRALRRSRTGPRRSTSCPSGCPTRRPRAT